MRGSECVRRTFIHRPGDKVNWVAKVTKGRAEGGW